MSTQTEASEMAVAVIEGALKRVQLILHEEWVGKVQDLKLDLSLKYGNSVELTVTPPDFGKKAMTLVAEAIVTAAIDRRSP